MMTSDTPLANIPKVCQRAGRTGKGQPKSGQSWEDAAGQQLTISVGLQSLLSLTSVLQALGTLDVCCLSGRLEQLSAKDLLLFFLTIQSLVHVCICLCVWWWWGLS